MQCVCADHVMQYTLLCNIFCPLYDAIGLCPLPYFAFDAFLHSFVQLTNQPTGLSHARKSRGSASWLWWVLDILYKTLIYRVSQKKGPFWITWLSRFEKPGFREDYELPLGIQANGIRSPLPSLKRLSPAIQKGPFLGHPVAEIDTIICIYHI